MNKEEILQQLRDEVGRIDEAITALEGRGSSSGKRQTRGARSGGITAAGRKRLSAMMKKRWAARRAAASGKKK